MPARDGASAVRWYALAAVVIVQVTTYVSPGVPPDSRIVAVVVVLLVASFVNPDGTVHAGRPEWATGAHCQGYNYRSIGVNLVGNFEYLQPTEAQIESLTLLMADLMETYSVPPEQVTGHKVWNATACPGANLDAIMPEIVAKAVMA